MLIGVEMNQYYVGLDLGTKWIYATMIDEEKCVIRDAKIPCTEVAIDGFFAGMPKGMPQCCDGGLRYLAWTVRLSCAKMQGRQSRQFTANEAESVRKKDG
jgi:hypothetical protein